MWKWMLSQIQMCERGNEGVEKEEVVEGEVGEVVALLITHKRSHPVWHGMSARCVGPFVG